VQACLQTSRDTYEGKNTRGKKAGERSAIPAYHYFIYFGESMKFIHLSDIRIGSPSENGSHWSSARQGERFRTLQKVLDLSREEKAGLILISGGLFAHQPVTSELEQINALFRQYPEREIVIIAGETDRVRGSSPVRSFVWAPNVHYVLSGHVEQIFLPALKAEVYAASATTEGSSEPGSFLLADLKAAVSARPTFSFSLEESRAYSGRPSIRIALLRTKDDRGIQETFRKLEFTYVAVGRESGRREIIPDLAYDPGCLEPESMRDSGAHGVYVGEADEESGKLIDIRFVPMAAAAYVPLKISVSQKTTAEELEKLVRSEIARRGEANIYRLKLTGSRDPEEHFDLEQLKKKYRIDRVVDETEPVYDFETLFAEHPQDMIGYYIGTIINSGKEMSNVERRAMYYGIDALLKSSEGGKT